MDPGQQCCNLPEPRCPQAGGGAQLPREHDGARVAATRDVLLDKRSLFLVEILLGCLFFSKELRRPMLEVHVSIILEAKEHPNVTKSAVGFHPWPTSLRTLAPELGHNQP